MTITLNVLITLTSGVRIFSVWADPVCGITGIEHSAGTGFTVSEAVEDWYDRLPSYFFIDDESTLHKERISYRIRRPFMVEKGENPRIFTLS